MDFIHVTLRFSDKKFSKNRIMLSSQSLHENGWCTLLSEACIGNPMGLPMGGVSDPLFLNDLKDEFKAILNTKANRPRKQKLSGFREKLASLRFLDPACGSGNFLTETYLSLRRLENEAIKEEFDFKSMLADFSNPIKVGIHQFYGIEINDFAVTVAKTALWIAESQMMAETEKIVQRDLDFLPLKNYSHIVEGNALHLDWAQVIAPSELNYIIGNPPFLGARVRIN